MIEVLGKMEYGVGSVITWCLETQVVIRKGEDETICATGLLFS